MLSLFLSGSLVAQCLPSQGTLNNYNFSFSSDETAGTTEVAFAFDVPGNLNKGALGFDLWIHLASPPPVLLTLNHDLEGSWIFGSASIVVALQYSQATQTIHFKIVRTDCSGAMGNGFTGKVTIQNSLGEIIKVSDVEGGIILIDNIEAG